MKPRTKPKRAKRGSKTSAPDVALARRLLGRGEPIGEIHERTRVATWTLYRWRKREEAEAARRSPPATATPPAPLGPAPIPDTPAARLALLAETLRTVQQSIARLVARAEEGKSAPGLPLFLQQQQNLLDTIARLTPAPAEHEEDAVRAAGARAAERLRKLLGLAQRRAALAGQDDVVPVAAE